MRKARIFQKGTRASQCGKARSMSVAAFLLNNGFEDVSNITGGIDAWSLSADPGVPRY